MEKGSTSSVVARNPQANKAAHPTAETATGRWRRMATTKPTFTIDSAILSCLFM